MPKHEPMMRRAAPLFALLLLLVAASCGWSQTQSQEGLPVELVIADEPPYAEQLVTMRALYETAKEAQPKGGIINGLRSMFSGQEKANYAPVADLVKHAPRLRGELVETEGIYEAREERGVLRSMGAEILVELMGGVQPQGFEATEGRLDGMPVQVRGRVETEGDRALLRAEAIAPSALVAGLRVARILELQEDWAAAADAYEEVAKLRALASRPLMPFARIRGGMIALQYLEDKARARAQFSAAWQPYSVQEHGQPLYFTWVPVAGDGWEKQPVSEALAPRLDRLNSETVAYKVVDVFVRMAGGSTALGVLLLAFVVRLAILPLSRKQMESQRRMQAIQPQIKALQEEYATDQQKFQSEFWKLCQENKCNPLGGCLPMLIQMPILIFLYRGIRDYIVQFEGARFLWIANLAQPDLLLLILYTLSMIAFQKLAAQNQPMADPQQAQQQKMMMWMMPLMFFFFFQSFPAAFILYWLGSNVIYFGEQALYMRRQAGAVAEKAVTEKAVAARPQGKSAGGFMAALAEAAKAKSDTGSGAEGRGPSYEEKRRQTKKSKRRK